MDKNIDTELREKVYSKYDGHCAYCGQEITFDKMQIDYFTPSNVDPDDSYENLMPCCKPCSCGKRSEYIENYREHITRSNKAMINQNQSFQRGVRFGLIKVKDIKVKFYYEKRKSRT